MRRANRQNLPMGAIATTKSTDHLSEGSDLSAFAITLTTVFGEPEVRATGAKSAPVADVRTAIPESSDNDGR